MLRRALIVLLAFASFASAATALTLGARAEKHVREGHFASGRRSRGKSLFLPDVDLRKLVRAAEAAKPRRERNGRDKRVADAGAVIGSDGRSGKPLRTYVVIAEPDGQVVTMYPGR